MCATGYILLLFVYQRLESVHLDVKQLTTEMNKYCYNSLLFSTAFHKNTANNYVVILVAMRKKFCTIL